MQCIISKKNIMEILEEHLQAPVFFWGRQILSSSRLAITNSLYFVFVLFWNRILVFWQPTSIETDPTCSIWQSFPITYLENTERLILHACWHPPFNNRRGMEMIGKILNSRREGKSNYRNNIKTKSTNLVKTAMIYY